MTSVLDGAIKGFDNTTGNITIDCGDITIEDNVYADNSILGIKISHNLGVKGSKGAFQNRLANCKNPVVAFAYMASYFAGEQETVMNNKLEKYKEQHDEYKNCLRKSKYAHEKKAIAAADSESRKKLAKSNGSFESYINSITGNKFSKMDKGNDDWHNKDEWQSFIDVINKQKDIESTDLNKLSTEMDMAVKDSSEAEQMAANAVKKATDLMSTQGRTSGG
ncbi:hypothetical protein KAJ27_24550 [bacterium]|nr:hypothetical protein [bacterium]